VRQVFSKISLRNLSYLRAASGRDGTSSGRSHVRYNQFPYKASRVRTAELQHTISISAMHAFGPSETVVRTVEVELAISILVACASGRRLTDVQMGIFELRLLA
jgi:hypothetical protein